MGAKGGSKKPKNDAAAASTPASGNTTTTDTSKQKSFQQINVRHILCEKLSRSDEARAKLDAGENFSDVAKEYSEDKARVGGAIGWKKREDLVPDFAERAFNLAVSTTAKPVVNEREAQPWKSEFGYHIIMVEGGK